MCTSSSSNDATGSEPYRFKTEYILFVEFVRETHTSDNTPDDQLRLINLRLCLVRRRRPDIFERYWAAREIQRRRAVLGGGDGGKRVRIRRH